MMLSANFTLAEFLRSQTAARMGRKIEPTESDIRNLTRLCVTVLEPLRLYISPVCAFVDEANHCRANLVFLGQSALNASGGKFTAYVANITGRQFSFAVHLPGWSVRSAMFFFVGGVLNWRIPAKILKAIIRRVAVVMATIHARRAWANESLQDKTMNPCVLANIVLMKRCLNIAATILVRPKYAAASTGSRHAPQSAEITDFVKPFVANYGTPVFHATFA